MTTVFACSIKLMKELREDQMSKTSDMDQQMRELIAQARAEKKWLWGGYHDIWFSPDQLEEQRRLGKFMWGPENWKLRDPTERIEEAQKRRDAAQSEVDRVIDQVTASMR